MVLLDTPASACVCYAPSTRVFKASNDTSSHACWRKRGQDLGKTGELFGSTSRLTASEVP